MILQVSRAKYMRHLCVREKGADSEQQPRKVEEVPLAKKHLLHCYCCSFCAILCCYLQLELCLCVVLDRSAPVLKGGQTEKCIAL